MSRFQRLFVVLSLLCGLSSCKSESHVEPSFYYWKTRYDLCQKDSAALAALAVKRLYVRFFDIVSEWDDQGVPAGRLENAEPFPSGVEIIPVIFITNRTFTDRDRPWHEDGVDRPTEPEEDFTRNDSSSISSLAENLVRKTLRMAKRYTNEPLRELQLDCDWSPSTRAKYFYLVSEVKRRVPDLLVSVTIRLHQYRYAEKTGIPPADRGMLMYYNMSNLKDTATRNYILDNDEGEKYLKGSKKYPLPLDFALPIHSQGTVFFHAHYEQPPSYRFSGLLTADQFGLLRQLGDHLVPTEGSKYLIKQSHDFSNDKRYYWVHEGDLVRYDEVSNEALLRAAKNIAPLANTSPYRVVFFHLDSLNLTTHSSETLAAIVDQFR